MVGRSVRWLLDCRPSSERILFPKSLRCLVHAAMVRWVSRLSKWWGQRSRFLRLRAASAEALCLEWCHTGTSPTTGCLDMSSFFVVKLLGVLFEVFFCLVGVASGGYFFGFIFASRPKFPYLLDWFQVYWEEIGCQSGPAYPSFGCNLVVFGVRHKGYFEQHIMTTLQPESARASPIGK